MGWRCTYLYSSKFVIFIHVTVVHPIQEPGANQGRGLMNKAVRNYILTVV